MMVSRRYRWRLICTLPAGRILLNASAALFHLLLIAVHHNVDDFTP